MYRCAECGGNMKFIYTVQGGYWICAVCGYTPQYEITNGTKIKK